MAYADNLTWRWKVGYRSAGLDHTLLLRFPSAGTGPDVSSVASLQNAVLAAATILPKDFAFLSSEKSQPLSDIFVPATGLATPGAIAVSGWDNTLGVNKEWAAAEMSRPYKATDGVTASYTDFSLFGVKYDLLADYADNPYRHVIADDGVLTSFYDNIGQMPLVVRAGWAAVGFGYVNLNRNSVQESRVRKG